MEHDKNLNPCKCGSTEVLDIDSDDMVPCWGVTCHTCKQFQHGDNWSYWGAVNAWNKANPIEKPKEEIPTKPIKNVTRRRRNTGDN